MATIRVLLLPGYNQNATLFQNKVAAIQRECGPQVEFTFLDPPMILQPWDWDANSNAEAGTQELNSTSAPDVQAPELLPRAWWRSNSERTTYAGLESAIEYIRDFLAGQERPFTGVLGFSQGASMATLLLALLERPHLYPSFLIDGKPPASPLKFGIFVSAFRPVDTTITHLTSSPYKILTPTLHVIGQTDMVMGEARAKIVIDACQDPRIERHSGGFFVPTKPRWRRFFKEYFESFAPDSKIKPSDVPSPNT